MYMKKLILFAIVLCTWAGCGKKTEKTTMRAATFNIRLDTTADGENSWPYRKERVCRFITEQQIDLVGTQEVLHRQFEDLQACLPGYAGIGVGRDDGKTGGEYSAIFYRTDKFEALESGTFWLSEHPDSVGRKGWDAACVRIATWAKMKDLATGNIFMAVNTHFDHIGTEARRQSALLIIRKVKEIVGDRPAIITGDFNVNNQSEAYRTMTNDEFRLLDAHLCAEQTSGADYTFHDFTRTPMEEREKIDFVFVTPHIKVLRSDIPKEIPGQLLSDHNPQVVDLTF